MSSPIPVTPRRSSDDRPMSPSPPRETRHTASRPPSLLFGAPPVGTVATSASVILSGLPPTPSPKKNLFGRLGRKDKDPQRGFFDSVKDKGKRKSREGSIFLDTGDVEGESIRGRTTAAESLKAESTKALSIKSKHSQESISSTSSSSPPLGAASILAALAGDTRNQSSPAKDIASQPPVFRTSGSSVVASEAPKQRFPPSPPTIATPSATEGARSLPRLHQPTVIRRPSGKGVSFVPQPAEVSSPGQPFAIHQPGLRSPSPFGPSRSRRSISPIRRNLDNYPGSTHNRSLPDLADMLRRGTIEVSPLRGRPQSVTETVEYGGAPSPRQVAQANEDAKSDELHEVLESGKSSPPLEYSNEADATHSEAKEEKPETTQPAPKTDNVQELIPELGEDRVEVEAVGHEVGEREEERILNEVKPSPVVSTSRLSIENDDRNSRHEASTAAPTDESQAVSDSASSNSYVPPYKPRLRLQHPGSAVSPITDHTLLPDPTSFALSFAASLTGHSTIPFTSSRRLELDLAWLEEPKSFTWVPCRRYIPEWHLRYVGPDAKSGINSESSWPSPVGIAKGVISRLPVVSRAAHWL